MTTTSRKLENIDFLVLSSILNVIDWLRSLTFFQNSQICICACTYLLGISASDTADVDEAKMLPLVSPPMRVLHLQCYMHPQCRRHWGKLHPRCRWFFFLGGGQNWLKWIFSSSNSFRRSLWRKRFILGNFVLHSRGVADTANVTPTVLWRPVILLWRRPNQTTCLDRLSIYIL